MTFPLIITILFVGAFITVVVWEAVERRRHERLHPLPPPVTMRLADPDLLLAGWLAARRAKRRAGETPAGISAPSRRRRQILTPNS